ncbi:MAG TPA: glutamate synthase subunit alpha, partial [Myxococcota bacterium]|nr:glutamate synthase subunit alpha [Myxococcota bacterium]
MTAMRREKQGLYDPANEHDACGVGFVASIRGEKSHDVVQKGIRVLCNLEHRGACGCDPETGDGAGLLVQIPDAFMRGEAKKHGIELPPVGCYAVGMIFLAQDADVAAQQAAALERIAAAEGQRVLGWRDVPHDPTAIGRVARESLPRIRQVFVAAEGREARDQDAFERRLY